MLRYDCASGDISFKHSTLLNKQRSYDPTEVDIGAIPRTTWLYWREYAAGLVADGILLMYCLFTPGYIIYIYIIEYSMNQLYVLWKYTCMNIWLKKILLLVNYPCWIQVEIVGGILMHGTFMLTYTDVFNYNLMCLMFCKDNKKS